MTEAFRKAIEAQTGKSIEEISATPLEDLVPRSMYNVPGLISHDEVNRQLDQALRFSLLDKVDLFITGIKAARLRRQHHHQ